MTFDDVYETRMNDEEIMLFYGDGYKNKNFLKQNNR